VLDLNKFKPLVILLGPTAHFPSVSFKFHNYFLPPSVLYSMIEFPSPILSVSTEVVKDLDGEDALYGMWAGGLIVLIIINTETDIAPVFTKCKQSLKDGRRLENMSWRLWYREMSVAHSPAKDSDVNSLALSDTTCPSPITPLSDSSSQNGKFIQLGSLKILSFNSPDFFALSDTSSDSLLAVPQEHIRHSWHGNGLPPPTTNIRRLSTASMPARPGARPHQQQRLGSILMDILPTTVQVPSRPAVPKATVTHKASAPMSNPSTAKPSPVQTSAASTYVYSATLSPGPVVVASPKATVAVPTIQLPSTTPTLTAPRVVVVNPTPHPTPPATPHPSRSPTITTSAQNAEYLSPPPLSPVSPALKASAAPTAGQNAPVKASIRNGTLSESPSQISPAQPKENPRRTSSLFAASPASTTSSNNKSDVAPVPLRRNSSKPTIRRGKEVPRFTTKSATKVQRPTMSRKATESRKPTFNIGSVSSNGTKADGHGQQMQKPPDIPRNQPLPKPKPPTPPKADVPTGRKALAVSTSSDYSTDSDDDSDWASEGNSAEDKDKERRQRESKLRAAAEEAQRQRDMFAKVPKRSYTNLTNRTRSGLLSQLMNPDPALFPPSHPYRQSHSTQDVTQFGKQGGRLLPLNYQTSRSSAVLPLAAKITPMNAQAPPTNGAGNSVAYRPKGIPHGQELETDTEEEGTDNGLELSRSLAQQKLAALAGPSRRRQPDQVNAPSGLARSKAAHEKAAHPSVVTAPIPLNHPYNLPPPAPPMTPRTTRRQMLSTELSESLRRNLLWERQVSKVNMLGTAKRAGQRAQPLATANTQNDQPVDEREERRRAAMARNHSWADDFHYAGW
jgi:hypothetical protein